MRKSRFTEEQILGIVAEAEQVPVGEAYRRHGISSKGFVTKRREVQIGCSVR